MTSRHPYADLLKLARPEPQSRPRMPRIKRAAQFAPFSALEGYEESIADRGRHSDEKPLLSDHMAERLDRRLQALQAQGDRAGPIVVTYFLPNPLKAGGRIQRKKGRLQKLDPGKKSLVFADGDRISLAHILALEGDFFEAWQLGEEGASFLPDAELGQSSRKDEKL